MNLRVLRSIIVGIGFTTLVAILSLIVFWIYFLFVWQPQHPGLGAVAGGLYPMMWVLPIAFIVGFWWDWRHSRAE